MTTRRVTTVSISKMVEKEIDLRTTARGTVEGRNYKEGGRSGAINKCLERYFVAASRARSDMREIFSEGDLLLIAMACNQQSVFNDPRSIALLASEVKYGMLGTKGVEWDTQHDLLIEKISALTFFQKVALLDAVEKWQNEPAETRGDIL